MKLIIATYGTEGDVRPLAALGRALLDAGHDVRLLADRSTLHHADARGVPTSALSGDIKGIDDPQAAIDAVVGNDHSMQGMAKALAHIANTHANAWLREIVDAGQGADAICLVEVDGEVPAEVLSAITKIPAVRQAKALTF